MFTAAHRFRAVVYSLAAAVCVLAFSRAEAQAVVKVNDDVNFRLGFFLQSQADFQELANATSTGSGGFQENLLIRRIRFVLGGQVAKDVFFYFDTENSNLGKAPKALATGFNILDAAVEWRIVKEFNIQAGQLLVPVNREIIKSSASTFMLDQSAYNQPDSTALQNNAGRDTGAMVRGYFFGDRLEYRSLVLSGLRLPNAKNSPRFTERLQWNFLDTEVYTLPSYAGANFGRKKILDVGGSYDTQSDLKVASADIFLDVPIGVGSFESTVFGQYINGGKFVAALPEENTFTAEAGVFLKDLKIAPIVRYEQKAFTQAINAGKNEHRYVAGLNYYPYPKAENNFNIKFWWQRVTPKVGFATNQFTVQMQAYYF
jgi:hypothetical protein